MLLYVRKSKKFTKHMPSMRSNSVDSIGSIIEQRWYYHDLKQLKAVGQIKLKKIFCCDQILYEKKWKCVNFKCYSSEELITLNTLHKVVPTWYSFHSWVDWSNADKVSCSRRKHIDAEDWTVNLCIQNRHSNHYTNCSHIYRSVCANRGLCLFQ